MPLSPASRARSLFLIVILGLRSQSLASPQALCCRPLRGLNAFSTKSPLAHGIHQTFLRTTTRHDIARKRKRASLVASPASLGLIILFWMALGTLEHRDVSQVDGVPKRFVPLVTSLALPIRQTTEIDRMLNVECFRNTQWPR